MNFKPYFLFGLLLVLCCISVNAQENLKELREKPGTQILNADTIAKIQIKQITVPIPQLGLKVNYWKHWTKFGINANQSSFSDSWNAGGVNSVALSGLIWHKSDYTKDRFNFVTELDMKYGKVWNEDQLPKKNVDRIFWDNKIAHRISEKWSVYFSLTFESQFDVGYKYGRNQEGKEVILDTVSAFMAPGYFTESLGLEYKLDKAFSLRLGTGTARQTLVLNNKIAPKEGGSEVYGVEPGKKFRNDLAFQITANLDRNLSQNLNLKARYNLFADYKDVTDPDQRLDVTVTAKITKLVSVTASGVVFYDPDQQNGRVQFSQALSMGLIYSLPK
ncbi:DUF3078 domain-containing protein [Sphingobacterium rhinopitheci]|uniref:DUF3078 domain-containing protein n=1 Tax=Sphingobacterium rhinopitheci TaxID=2781960 RepID=UPI001F52AA85|nr:DUF3078 domain-containing protein [Sphingobacterium rhinopitheci]MCI0921557.1 DUF3078 domain-containing protein [Sphingobacterium rhinopitheci]